MISKAKVLDDEHTKTLKLKEEEDERIRKGVEDFYAKAAKQKIKKKTQDLTFSPASAILKDLKNKRTFDVIKIKEEVDSKPFCFDFGSGNILVFRYKVHCIDAELMLYVPAIKSFKKKIQVGKFYEIASKRNFHYEVFTENCDKWIIYVNRIKNLSLFDMKIKDRMIWQTKPKSKDIKFGFDENWLDKSLPIPNNLENLDVYFETTKDINKNSLLSAPLNVLRLEFIRQIEIHQKTGSIIKNLEYQALLHNNKVVRIYVPYFLKDIISNLTEKLLNNNLIINKLKLFFKKEYIGFLWDCTLSGFIFKQKKYEQKLMSIREGRDFFETNSGINFTNFLHNKNNKKQKHSPKKRHYRNDDDRDYNYNRNRDRYDQDDSYYRRAPRKYRRRSQSYD